MTKFTAFLKPIATWINGLFKDEIGTPSSKRFVGIISSLTLCFTLLFAIRDSNITIASMLIDAVLILAISTLGLSSVDKFIKNKNESNKSNPENN
jgi:hypothetical protein